MQILRFCFLMKQPHIHLQPHTSSKLHNFMNHQKGYHWTNKNQETALRMSGSCSISSNISVVLLPCWSWKPDPAHTHYWRSDPESQQRDEYFQDMPAHCPWCPHTWRRRDQHTDDKSLYESETVKQILKSKQIQISKQIGRPMRYYPQV